MRATISVQPAAALPTVTLTSPSDGATFVEPAEIRLTAEVVAGAAAITQVTFREGANAIGQLLATPYTLVWSNVSAGVIRSRRKLWIPSGNRQSRHQSTSR